MWIEQPGAFMKVVVALSIIFLVATYFNTTKNHYINLENGKHTFVTIVWSIMINADEDMEYFECAKWSNPYPGIIGQLELSSCLLHQKCESKEDSALKNACST